MIVGSRLLAVVYRRIERVFPFIPWHPRVFEAEAERKRPCINYRSRIDYDNFFRLSASINRYRIELDSRWTSNTKREHLRGINATFCLSSRR